MRHSELSSCLWYRQSLGGRVEHYALDLLQTFKDHSSPLFQRHAHSSTKDSSTNSTKGKTCLYSEKKKIKNQFGANELLGGSAFKSKLTDNMQSARELGV